MRWSCTNKQLDRALVFFRKSRSNNVDPQMHAETGFTEGEILYNQQVHACRRGVCQVQHHPGSYLSELHNDADYARGYAHFKSEKYTDAFVGIPSYGNRPQDDPSRMRDVRVRTADCFYALKSFEQAGEYYDRVLARGVKPMDYALFQAPWPPSSTRPWGQVTRLEQCWSISRKPFGGGGAVPSPHPHRRRGAFRSRRQAEHLIQSYLPHHAPRRRLWNCVWSTSSKAKTTRS